MIDIIQRCVRVLGKQKTKKETTKQEKMIHPLYFTGKVVIFTGTKRGLRVSFFLFFFNFLVDC